tara:strand:- start:479 stop:793 length:315 start_codon:yes stop_codon:yes gene_type:complete
MDNENRTIKCVGYTIASDSYVTHEVKNTSDLPNNLVSGQFVEFNYKLTDEERQAQSTRLCAKGYEISESNSADSKRDWPIHFTDSVKYAISKAKTSKSCKDLGA